jgi:hypothetical protein
MPACAAAACRFAAESIAVPLALYPPGRSGEPSPDEPDEPDPEGPPPPDVPREEVPAPEGPSVKPFPDAEPVDGVAIATPITPCASLWPG